jgi:hypothetical protein
VIYNLDFSLLYPFLFETAPDGRPVETHRANVVQPLLRYRDHAVSYRLGITGPTHLELLDQLEHRRESLTSRFANLNELCDRWRYADPRDRSDLLAQAQPIIRQLSFILQHSHDPEILRATTRMRDLINREVIVPVGDLLGTDPPLRRDFRHRYDTALDRISAQRSLADHRSPEDASFHYKVDSLNVAISGLTDPTSGYKVLFATPQRENIEQCRTARNSYARHPLVPVLILGATILHERGYIRDATRFLEGLFRRTSDGIDALEIAKSLDGLTPDETRELDRLTVDVATLAQACAEEETPTERPGPPALPDINAILARPTHVQEAAKKAERQIIAIANQLTKAIGLDESLQELAGLSEDPIVRKIKTNLKLT